MTEAPDWALAVPAVGVHNPPPRVPGPDLLQITWQQMQQVISGLVNEFLRQVAVALGAIEIFGFKPYQALVEIGEDIAAAKTNFDLLLSAFGLPTMDAVANLLANQANDFATFLAATGQATFAALGAALQSLIDFLTAIPANLLSGALPTNVTLSGTQLGTLLQYLNSSGQYAAAQLTGSINGALTLGGTTLSTLFTNINGSGQLLASGLTGGLNTAVTFGGTALSTFFQNINASGQLLAPGITGALNGALTLGGATLSTLVTNINSSGQLLASGITGALGTGLTVGGVTLGTLFTNINSSGQLVLSGATGALNTAVTLGGTALSTLSTNWNAAVTNVNSLISGVSGASTAADVATNINLAATNIAQIGTAAQNAAAGVVGSLNTAATQVQTAFSGILNGLFGGLIGMSAPSGVSQAQAGVALQGVTTNVIGTSTALMAIKKQEAVKAGMISAKFNFADYANGSLPAAFSVVNDNYAGAPAPGGIVIQNGRAVYSPGVSGYASLPAARYTTPMASDYQEISWTSTGDPVFARHAYLRANSSFATFLRCTIGATVIDLRTVVGGVQTAIASLAYAFKPGARYTLKAGDLSDKYTIYLYENDRLVWTVTDSSHLHQVGASYRYGAFGILGLNDGSTQDYGVDSVLIADQVFQPGPPAEALVSTQQTTSSATYANLATTGPAVTVTIGSSGMALVCPYAHIAGDTLANTPYMGVDVSGATTLSANDNLALGYSTSSSSGQFAGAVHLYSGLNPGSNTFTSKYRRGGSGSGYFSNRRLAVIPL